MSKKYIFVIDTDLYAGNFEREMCAYITGLVGECGVGENIAELYYKETGEEESRFVELVEYRPDEDHACCRPTSIWKSKDGEYNSVAIFFYEKPSEEDINFMKDRAHKFKEAKQNYGRYSYDKNFELNILGFRLIEESKKSSEKQL